MPKPYGTNHQVHIRSIVEHVLVLQRLSESPFHASRHSNSRNSSLQRAPGAAEGGGDGVYRDIGDAMAGASIQADSHAFEVLAHAHVHAASAAGGSAAVARGPEERGPEPAVAVPPAHATGAATAPAASGNRACWPQSGRGQAASRRGGNTSARTLARPCCSACCTAPGERVPRFLVPGDRLEHEHEMA